MKNLNFHLIRMWYLSQIRVNNFCKIHLLVHCVLKLPSLSEVKWHDVHIISPSENQFNDWFATEKKYIDDTQYFAVMIVASKVCWLTCLGSCKLLLAIWVRDVQFNQ